MTAIAELIRAERRARGWSQDRLAEALCHAAGLRTVDRHIVSRWERGDRTPEKFWLRAFAQVFELPLATLERAARGEPDLPSDEELPFNSDMQRRLFLASVAASALGAAETQSLERVLHGLEHLPLRVGLAEVEAVEHAAEAYMSFDLARQGDLAATVAQSALVWATSLFDRQMSEPLTRRLSSAIGLVADRFGWETYDHGDRNRAARILNLGLDHAARGDDRDLRAHVMLDLSTVTTDAGYPDDGVKILEAALGDVRISAAERGNLHAVCARHCATAGDREGGLRHVALAEEASTRTDTALAPEWARQITYSPGHRDSALGLALFALGEHDRALYRLSSALAHLDGGRTRTTLRCRARLSALLLLAGDRAGGEREARRVLADAAGVKSTRVRDDLGILRDYARRVDARVLVRDLSVAMAAA